MQTLNEALSRKTVPEVKALAALALRNSQALRVLGFGMLA